MNMTEDEITKTVVHAVYCIHKHSGLGLYETVYEVCLLHELKKPGFENTWLSFAPLRRNSKLFFAARLPTHGPMRPRFARCPISSPPEP